MIFAAYAVFLALIVWAGAARTPLRQGAPWRAVVLAVSMASLLLFVTLGPQQDGPTSLGALLVASGIAGSAVYTIGAAVWTGVAAYRLREVRWILTAVAFGFPSTLTLAMPLVGLLAFALAPMSRYAPEQVRSAAA